jgi:hypothetical protein
MSQGGPNAYTLAALGTSAWRHVRPNAGGWTLQHRHPDTNVWSVISHHPTKALARETAKAFVAAGYGDDADFRVRRAPAPE